MNNVQLSGNMARYSKTGLARNGNAFAFLTVACNRKTVINGQELDGYGRRKYDGMD